MCGACGTAGADHWSAPYLAGRAPRAAAARAVTALAGSRSTVIATAGGFLVRTPTGRTVVARDLGAVWAAFPTGRLVEAGDLPGTLRGPATVPPPRTARMGVVLVTEGQGTPADGASRECRGWTPAELVAELSRVAAQGRRTDLWVSVHRAELPRLLPELRAHPSRPFAVRALLDGARPAPPLPLTGRCSFLDRLPALLAWLAALEAGGQPVRMQLRLPLGQGRTLALALIDGTVTRASAGTAASEYPASAAVSAADPAVERSLAALLGVRSAGEL